MADNPIIPRNRTDPILTLPLSRKPSTSPTNLAFSVEIPQPLKTFWRKLFKYSISGNFPTSNLKLQLTLAAVADVEGTDWLRTVLSEPKNRMGSPQLCATDLEFSGHRLRLLFRIINDEKLCNLGSFSEKALWNQAAFNNCSNLLFRKFDLAKAFKSILENKP